MSEDSADSQDDLLGDRYQHRKASRVGRFAT